MNEMGSSGMAFAVELARYRSCAVRIGHSIAGEKLRNHGSSRSAERRDSHLGRYRGEVGRGANLEHMGNAVELRDAYRSSASEHAGGPASRTLALNGGNSIG